MKVLRSVLRIVTRYTPLPRLGYCILAGSVFWLLPRPLGLYAGLTAALAIAAITLVDFVLLPARASLGVEREISPNIGIGDAVSGSYTLANRSRRHLHLELHDHFPALVRGGGLTHLELPAQSSKRVEFAVTGLKRGASELGDAGVRMSTSLGLVSASYVFGLKNEFRVVPSMAGVRRFRLLAMQHRLNSLGVRVLRHKGGGQSFASLREYVLGDDPRHIDWKATSRREKLITREFTVERSQTVMTLIDAGRGMTQLSGDYPRFEHALSSALILTDVASNAGDRVGTLVFDDEVRAFVPAQASRGALQLVRNALVPVVATSREPDYASAFRFLAAHQGKRALIVFFTDVIDTRASQALLAHVTRSSARHLVLVVALRNDSVYDAAHLRSDGTPAVLFENVAAEEVIQAREEALHRMRRAGVIVLDVSPKVMTASVVNQYLELKSRGAL
ncbi:MAG: DUF58 domain-containing protein [Phycisphaerae bacterium]|nr:DUF58 domain-containing protein [Gemmatimonadaceae bacterium]